MNHDAAVLRDHDRERVLRHQERAFEADVDRVIPFLFRAIRDCLRKKDAGVVEKDVDPAERLDRRVHGPLAIACDAHVGSHEDRRAATPRDLVHDSLAS